MEARHVLAARDRLHGRPGSFNVVRCSACGLMRTQPRPNRETIAFYYPADYGPYVETSYDDKGWLRRLGRRLLAPRDTSIPPMTPGRLLECGSASGSYLLEMQKAGWAVTGLELDPESAARARSRTNAHVHCGDIEHAPFEDEAFDLVCAWMTLEHVHDPVASLRRIHGWLRPGGWLAFSVPDCGGWQFAFFRENWFALQVPSHLHHFTDATLRSLLTGCGFSEIQTRWQRTLYDVAASLALAAESRFGARAGAWCRRAADSLPSRGLCRLIGVPGAALRLTGRLTIWAKKPA